jgi:hypothetical protein
MKKKIKYTPKPKKVSKKQPKSTVPVRCCCERKEAARILKANMHGDDKLNEASDFLFAKSFILSLLKEQEEIKGELPAGPPPETAPEDFTPEKNQEDFKNSLEPETDASQFDIEGISSDVTLETINKVKSWALKLNDFEKFLNEPTDDSLHRILADNDRAGSLLRGITRKASDSITRIAGEIAKLKEVLNTFVNVAPKKIRDLSDIQGSGVS